jgi:hypothetical protein
MAYTTFQLIDRTNWYGGLHQSKHIADPNPLGSNHRYTKLVAKCSKIKAQIILKVTFRFGTIKQNYYGA